MSKFLIVFILTMAILLVAGAVSGCSMLNQSSPVQATPSGTISPGTGTATATTTPGGTATVLPAGDIKINVSGDTITVTGGAGKNIRSDKNISLSSKDFYIVNVTHGGAPTSLCLLSIGDKAVPNTVSDWGDKAAIYYPIGTFISGEYPVIVKEAYGPWTMVIQKNPKAEPLVTGQKVNGSAGFTNSQYFHLNKKKATFRFTRNTLVEHYAAGIHLVLYSMDTGTRTDYLWWNMSDASHEYTINIPADGNYVISGGCMSDWEASITQ